MPNCANDYTIIITAVAIQVPILAGVIVNWLTSKINAEKSHSRSDVISGKVDALTTLTIDGFKSPKPDEKPPI